MQADEQPDGCTVDVLGQRRCHRKSFESWVSRREENESNGRVVGSKIHAWQAVLSVSARDGPLFQRKGARELRYAVYPIAQRCFPMPPVPTWYMDKVHQV